MENKVAVQADIDERDLKRVVVGTYCFAALVGAGTLMSIFTWGSALVSTMSPFVLIMGLVSILGGIAYCWANIHSAKAITAREDPHLSYFVAGMNMVAFPLGTLLSMYTWRVLSRPTVRDIYADPHRAPSLPPRAAAGPKPIKQQEAAPRVAPEVHLKQYEDVEEALWQEMEREHKKRTAQEAADKIKIVPAEE